jgi:putative solute:sodium symporter small subunit
MSDSDGQPAVSPEEARAYWRANLRIMALLLSIWAFVSYGLGILWVEPLNRFHLGGFPLGFWFAQQGSIYAFVVLIAVYVVWMDRLDRRHGVG